MTKIFEYHLTADDQALCDSILEHWHCTPEQRALLARQADKIAPRPVETEEHRQAFDWIMREADNGNTAPIGATWWRSENTLSIKENTPHNYLTWTVEYYQGRAWELATALELWRAAMNTEDNNNAE